MPSLEANYPEVGSLRRRRLELGITLSELAAEFKRTPGSPGRRPDRNAVSRQTIAALEARDLVAPETVKASSRERYLLALERLELRKTEEQAMLLTAQIDAGEVLAADARRRLAELTT